MTDKKKQLQVLNKVIEGLAFIGIDSEDFATLISIRQTLKEYYKAKPRMVTVNGKQVEVTINFETGYNAYDNQIPYDMNPFRPETDQATEWSNGWRYAEFGWQL
jgi:hypothetical protein